MLYFRQMLKGKASMWAEAFGKYFESRNFEIVKEKFLNMFWDAGTRDKYWERVCTGTYAEGHSDGMLGYALKKITAAENCDPPIAEEQLVRIIVRQLPIATQTQLISVGKLSVDQLCELLKLHDQVNEQGRSRTADGRVWSSRGNANSTETKGSRFQSHVERQVNTQDKGAIPKHGPPRGGSASYERGGRQDMEMDRPKQQVGKFFDQPGRSADAPRPAWSKERQMDIRLESPRDDGAGGAQGNFILPSRAIPASRK